MLRLIGVALLSLPFGSSIVFAEDFTLPLPPLKRQPNPQAVRSTSAIGIGLWRSIHPSISSIYPTV